MQRNGGEAVPRCSGNDAGRADYCYTQSSSPQSDPTPTMSPQSNPTMSPQSNPTADSLQNIGNNGKPANVFPLGQCQGDCDDDNECQEGLSCMQRNGGEAVPGCS